MSTSDNWDDIAPICHGHTLQKYLVNIAPVLRKVLIFFFLFVKIVCINIKITSKNAISITNFYRNNKKNYVCNQHWGNIGAITEKDTISSDIT